MSEEPTRGDRAAGDDHPTAELERLIAGEADAAEQARAVRHLLAGCPRCTRWAARELGWADEEESTAGALDAVLARLTERAPSWLERVRHERQEAARRVAALEGRPPERALELLAAAPGHLRRALCERLIDRATASRHRDAAETLRWAEYAAACSNELHGPGAGELRVRAWSALGNARRIANDLAGADAAFAEAAGRLQDDGGDPLLRADFLADLASLRDYQRRLGEALVLIRRAARLYRRYGRPAAVAEALIKESAFQTKAGNTEEGLRAVWRGLSLLGPGADLEALVPGVHNLLLLVAESGRPQLARRLIELAAPLYRLAAGELVRIRLDWVRARIDLEEGELETAGRRLEAVRRRFADLDLPYDVAVASLDLAQVHARRGDTERLREVAAEMVPVFRRLGVARDLLAALATLNQAVARDAATLALLERLARAVGGGSRGRSPSPSAAP